jgi:hypothetical protein
VTIVGLYTNVPDGGRLADDQLRWLTHELKAAPGDAALLVALHHPVYSADLQHGSNLTLGEHLDAAFKRAGRWPDAVLTAHVHNYQRFARTVGGRTIPYIVARAGGYHNLHHVPVGNLPFTHPELDGLELVHFRDREFGYLLIDASLNQLTLAYHTVDDAQADTVTVPL